MNTQHLLLELTDCGSNQLVFVFTQSIFKMQHFFRLGNKFGSCGRMVKNASNVHQIN